MGASLNVAFDKQVAPYGTLTDDHNALGNGLVKLDKAHSKAGLTPLAGFVSADPAEWADMDQDDPEAALMPPEQWFAAADGLAAVEAAITHLEDKLKILSPDVLAELADIGTELTAAVKKNARFHFAIRD